MQSVSQTRNLHRLNYEFPKSPVISSVRTNNSKVNIPHQDFGFCSQYTSDCCADFKYVTEAELQAAVKRVRRARQKKCDEERWQNYLRLKQADSDTKLSENGVCPQCFLEDESPAPTQSESQNYCKNMQKFEKDEIQTSGLASAVGTGIADSIGHVYQLGGVLTKRLQDLVATVGRMTSLLLSSLTTRSVQYEDEDVDRAIKRSMEFDAMFARNHLYEIQRLLKDAKQLAAGKSPRGELESKISAALKCIMQAIQVYAKHVSKGARVKYQQVVPIFQSISIIHSLLEQLTGEHTFPFRQELEVSCSYMKQLLLEMSTTDTQSVMTVRHKPSRPKPATRHKPSADLSMYSRRRGDWRRKTASLARAKFGPPSGKKHKQKSDGKSDKRNLEINKGDFNEVDSQQSSFKYTEKIPSSLKETASSKEIPFRNATRAVPEDNVTTMMETIPNEPIEDGELCLDDGAFQALKRLNGKHPSFHDELILKNQTLKNENVDSLDLVEETEGISPKPSSSKCTFSLSQKSETKSPTASKPASARSVRGEPNNVQLICLKEEEKKKTYSICSDSQETSTYATAEGMSIAEGINEDIEDCLDRRTLTIDDQTKKEALEYHQSMIEYHKGNSHYKDGKALGIVDRLATRILTEMVMDFQKEEMNNVIQTLYNLEFQ